MKFIILILTFVFSLNSFASKKAIKPTSKIVSIDTCFKSEDSLEREFCQKKRMKAMTEEFETALNKYKEGYSQAEKDEAKIALNKEIQANKDLVKLIADELKLKEENLAKLEATLSNEEKIKAEQEKEANKQKEDVEKVKKALKKIFK